MTKGRFTKQEVTRALEAARAGGLEPCELTIGADGAICIRARDDEAWRTPNSVHEEIQRHFRHAKT